AAARPLGGVADAATLAGLSWLCGVAAALAIHAAREEAALVAGRVVAAPALAAATQARAVRVLAAALGTAPEPAPLADDPLIACRAMAARSSGLTVRARQGGLQGREGVAAVRAVALASGLFARRVRLQGEWWRDVDTGVLGFRPDGRPVALIPESGSLVAVDA